MVKSLFEYLSAVQEKISHLMINGNLRIYYRGEPGTYKKPMIPSVFRSDDSNFEKDNYYRALRRHPEEFNGLKSIDILSKLQHFRYSTRMLDFTVNSLVGLFFACGGYGKTDGTFKNNGNGHVHIYAADYEKDVLNFNSDKALLLSILPRFNEEQQKELKSLFQQAKDEQKLVTNQWVDQTIGKDNFNHQIRRYIHELRIERAGYEQYRMNPEHIFRGYFIKSNFTNRRVKIQGGLFAIMGLTSESFKQAFDVKKDTNYFDIEINVDAFDQILRELDYYCNINYSTLFDDLESTAKSYSSSLYRNN